MAVSGDRNDGEGKERRRAQPAAKRSKSAHKKTAKKKTAKKGKKKGSK